MTFLLRSHNIFEYLVSHKICDRQEIVLQIESKSSRNFNLVVSLKSHEGDRYLIVKQEPLDVDGDSLGWFLKEWRVHELFQFSELSHLRPLIAEAVHYDAGNSIISFKYLNNYGTLSDFYAEKNFSTNIASAIGAILAKVHSSTIDFQQYENFFAGNDIFIDRKPDFLDGLEPISPEIFSKTSVDNLKFYQIYQCDDRLRENILELNTTFECCCLTHHDIKLDNFLLADEWKQSSSIVALDRGLIRLIDWENCAWGDPAFDLGMAIACYLKMWLNSIAIDLELDLETALANATIPLTVLQPSIAALTKTYFQNFPSILKRRSDFLLRVVQYSGFALLRNLLIRLYYQQPFGYPELFGNKEVCKLQVAKTLLCAPERSLATVFGTKASELISARLAT